MARYRVLTLVLLGGVEAFPTVYPPKPEVLGGRCWFALPRRVMRTVSCLLGKLGRDSDTSTYGFYLELGQYS
jgi:hypothetical protein